MIRNALGKSMKFCDFIWLFTERVVLWSYIFMLTSQRFELLPHAYSRSYLTTIFMPPTSKKLEGHIASGTFVRACVRACVRASVRALRFLMHSITSKPYMLGFWNFIYGFFMKKIADPYFFPHHDYAPFLSYGPLKKYRWNLVSKISQKLLKLEPWNLVNRLVLMSRWPD